MKTVILAVSVLTGSACASEPSLNDFWEGKARFAVSSESLDTDTRSRLHFLSDVKQSDGRYFVYYIRNKDRMGTGLAYTRDWKSFTDAGTVLCPGAAGAWDARMSAFADVWKDGAAYHLVYEGASYSSAYPGDVGYATSRDGVLWTKQGIILKHSGGWESANNGTPSLFKVGTVWYLFYHGFDGTDCRVFAASGTSLKSLKRLNGGRPVVNTSASGWDSGTVGKRSVIQEGDFYWMVYEGSTDQPYPSAKWSSGLARSRDLVNWEKWRGTGGPVLPQTSTGMGFDGPEWVRTPDGKLNIFFRKPDNVTGRATLVWNTTPAQEWLFQAETQLSHQIGRRDADGWSAATALDRSGYLSYGPYITTITPGARSATWRLLIDNNTANRGSDTVATIEVYNADANRALASKSLLRRDFAQANAYQLFTLTFNAQAGQRLEFRVHWKDRAYIRQDYVRVR